MLAVCVIRITPFVTFSFVERDEAAYNEMLDEKRNKMLQVQKELDEQKNKLERAQKQNSKLSRDLRNAAGSKSELPEEVHIFYCCTYMPSALQFNWLFIIH